MNEMPESHSPDESGGKKTLNTHLVGTLILTGNKEIAIRSDEVYQSGDISEVERKMPSLV